MKLFKFEDFKIVIEPEALLLEPFKKIHKRDKNRDKRMALLELGFIYFYCDPRSDYQYIIDEEDRIEAIIEGEGLPKDWLPDKVVIEAVNFYNSFKTSAALLLEDTRIAVDKLRSLLRDIDLLQTDDKGKPVYTLNVITSTIKQVPSLIEDLNRAEKAISKDLLDSGKMRGQGVKTILEDDLTL